MSPASGSPDPADPALRPGPPDATAPTVPPSRTDPTAPPRPGPPSRTAFAESARRLTVRWGHRYSEKARKRAFLKLGPTGVWRAGAALAACGAVLLLVTAAHLDRSRLDRSAVAHQRGDSTTGIEVTVPRKGWYVLWEETSAGAPRPPAAKPGTTVRARAVKGSGTGLFTTSDDPAYLVRLNGRQTVGTAIAAVIIDPGTYRITVLRGKGASAGHGRLAFGPQPPDEGLSIGTGSTGRAPLVTATAAAVLFAVALLAFLIGETGRRLAARRFARALGHNAAQGGTW